MQEIDVRNKTGRTGLTGTAFSVFALIEESECPVFKCSVVLWCLGISLTVLSTFAALLSDSSLLAYLLPLACLPGLVAIAHISRERAETRRKGLILVSKGHTKLKAIRTDLSYYLKDLEDRACRHFGAITNTNVKAYYLLMQIHEALTERVRDITSIIDSGSSANLAKAYKLLQRPLQVEIGKANRLPLQDLEKVLTVLENRLESALMAIETVAPSSETADNDVHRNTRRRFTGRKAPASSLL